MLQARKKNPKMFENMAWGKVLPESGTAPLLLPWLLVPLSSAEQQQHNRLWSRLGSNPGAVG